MNGVMRFKRKDKLSPRCIEPFEILFIVIEVAYELTLSPNFIVVHSVSYISILQGYILYKYHVLRSDFN